MSFLRGSLNYVWCTTSVLGKGATGAVFQVTKVLDLLFITIPLCEQCRISEKVELNEWNELKKVFAHFLII